MGASSPMNCDIRKDKHTFILDAIAYQITFVFHSLNFINLTIFFSLTSNPEIVLSLCL